ncbi:MAG: ATP-binding protein, partial [Fibrobacteria bacterium]
FPWRGRDHFLILARGSVAAGFQEEPTNRDETERRKREAVLYSLLAQSPVALLAFDRNGLFTMAEGKGLDAMGAVAAELQGQSVFARPSPIPQLQGPVRRALDGMEVDESVEISGNIFEIHLRAFPETDGESDRESPEAADGSTGGGVGAGKTASWKNGIAGAMGLAVNVTERWRAEEDLRRNKEHLRTVISNAPIVLFALDAKGNFTLCEGRGLEAVGLKPGEVLGLSAFDIYRAAPQVRMNVRRALSGEEFTSTVEIGGLWFETYFSPVFKGYDEVAGVIGVAINITDRRRAEDALRQSEGQLRHSRKMEAIGRVAGGVAHDFNNLLTTITGYAEILLAGSNPRASASLPEADPTRSIPSTTSATSATRKSIEEIRKAADRATSLTRQLLAFSRRQVLTPKALRLNQMVGEMDKMLRSLIREDIELATALDPSLGEVWADPGQMEQVILNLALNARDAMPAGGHLSLETANVELEGSHARGELFLVPGSYVMMAVSDTGMGMDEEVKAHLFEPFFTTKDDGKGQGLGLSAVYGIVKQSGGTIAVESRKGRGTTFKVFLPRMDKRQIPDAASTSDSLKGVETVLLVEDEEAVRTLVREILRIHGYCVLEARQGGEAILISQRHKGPIHMLLTDMVMANMSGKELAEHLRPLRPEMHVLFISGHSEEVVLHGPGGIRSASPGEPGREGAPEHHHAFLAKPFTPKTLATKVREVLDGQTTERQEIADHF